MVKNKKIKIIIQIILFILALFIFLGIYNMLLKYTNSYTISNNKEEIKEDISMVLNITKENYDSEVINSDLPVIIDFYADWCGPCKMMSPVIDEIAEKYNGKVKVGKVDVDKESELASKFGVMSIPTIVIIKNGEVSKTFVGVQSKENIVKEI